MKLHIGLSEKLLSKTKDLPDEEAVQFLSQALNVERVDTKRLKKFKIVTAEGKDIDLKSVEAVEGVDWVEPDEMRVAY